MTKRRMPRIAQFAVLILAMAERARAQPGDPNLPNLSGGFITLAANPQGQEMLAYAWTQGTDVPPVISVSELKGTVKRPMSYLGYNGEGTWMTTDGSVYVLKGDSLRKTNLRLDQLPGNLRNGSAAYFTYTGIDPDKARTASGGAQPSNPALARSDGRAGASADPNLPNPSGGFVTLAPNPQGQEVVAYAWQGSDVPPQVFVSSMKGTRKVAMSYFGYDDEGTWIMGEGSVYVLKGNILRKTDLQVRQLPKNLRNGSPAYFSYTGIDPDKPKQDAGQTPSSAAPSGSRRPPHAPSASEQAAAPAGGRDARILREASGVTLVYSDADGEHRYRVQRPAMGLPGAAAQQLNAADTGGWIYVAPDGASGILFNVTADHAVTATKLPAQALGMLVRR